MDSAPPPPSSATNRPPYPLRLVIGRFVPYFVGGLFVVAAGVKVYGANYSPVPTMGVLSTAGVQNAVAVAELLLGVWLLSRVGRCASWLAATVTFVGFAAVSGYLGTKGVANCGCFGAVKASPWVAFGVDIAVLGLLAASAPIRSEWRAANDFGWLTWAASLAGGVVALGGVIGVGSYLIYGSAYTAVAKLRGEALAYDSYLDYGAGTPGVVVERATVISNHSDRTVTIVGGTSDCSCVTHSDLPVVIGPYQSGEVRIRLRPPAAEGLFTRTCKLLTDSDSMPVLPVTLGVEMTASQPVTEGGR